MDLMQLEAFSSYPIFYLWSELPEESLKGEVNMEDVQRDLGYLSM
jgi:hypothetical protein